MTETVARLLRGVLAVLGLIALADPVLNGPLVTVAVVALAAALLVVALLAVSMRARPRGLSDHPTRRTELLAPLMQSDPDAAGHIRRRGPGQAAAAA